MNLKNDQEFEKLFKLSGNALKVYLALLSFSNLNCTKPVCPSQRTLAEITSLTCNTIKTQLCNLEKAGLVKSKKRVGESTLYTFPLATSPDEEELFFQQMFEQITETESYRPQLSDIVVTHFEDAHPIPEQISEWWKEHGLKNN